jgi:dephospho-CoA kinase
MKVIAFAGMPFSGKSEAVQIAKDNNIPIVRMGDLVWEEVQKRGLELTDETVGRIANEMREKEGNDIWAKKTLKRIEDIDVSEFLVIDGVRNIEEIEAFKKVFGADFLLISIIAPDDIRHKRAMTRGRIDDSINIGDILKRDERETHWGIKELIKKADITFSNEGELKAFRNEMNEFFHTIKSS